MINRRKLLSLIGLFPIASFSQILPKIEILKDPKENTIELDSVENLKMLILEYSYMCDSNFKDEGDEWCLKSKQDYSRKLFEIAKKSNLIEWYTIMPDNKNLTIDFEKKSTIYDRPYTYKKFTWIFDNLIVLEKYVLWDRHPKYIMVNGVLQK